MDSTMTRTKRYLVYFGKSFCKDKVVMFFLILILLTIIGIIVVASLGPRTKPGVVPPVEPGKKNVTNYHYDNDNAEVDD